MNQIITMLLKKELELMFKRKYYSMIELDNEVIDYHIIYSNEHIFFKCNWSDEDDIKEIENYVDECNKINSNSTKIYINKNEIHHKDCKIVSNNSIFMILDNVDKVLVEIKYKHFNTYHPQINYIK